MECRLDGAEADSNDNRDEIESEQNVDEERRSTFKRAIQLQKKTTILMAPTPLELASVSVELYVSSIETLENFLPWQQKFIKLALKEQRQRENVFQSAEVIVDLQTKNWSFDDIGFHVFKHNTLFPNNPSWFGSSGNPTNDYYNLCTSTMLYITSIAQNNVTPPKLDYCNALVPTNISNAYNYIFWTRDFLNSKHDSKKHVLAFYGPPSVGKTRIFCKSLLSFMRSNCILGPPGKNPDFYFSPIVNKKAVLLEEFVLGQLQAEQLLTWFGGTSIEVPVKHKNNKKLEAMPILMNGNSKPSFSYDSAFIKKFIKFHFNSAFIKKFIKYNPSKIINSYF